jgi:hypothetical protein
MNRILSYAEAQSRVGLANDSIAFTVEELQDFITQVQADNLRIYFYKSNPAGRTNFIMSGYTEGVECNTGFKRIHRLSPLFCAIPIDTDLKLRPGGGWSAG